MDNNDILRRIRYALDISDSKMLEIFEVSGQALTHPELLNLLKREDDEGFAECTYKLLGLFLDGLIIKTRGPAEPRPGQAPRAPELLNNNNILKKLRIALEFREPQMLETFKLSGIALSKSELSALFRKKGHKNYKDCGDQLLRNFLQGLALRFRNPE
jgi:uncharacterized protein YehS (DUF1456 family)